MENAFVDLVADLIDLSDCYTNTGKYKAYIDTEIIKEQALEVVISWRNYQEECKKSITAIRQSLPASDLQQQP